MTDDRTDPTADRAPTPPGPHPLWRLGLAALAGTVGALLAGGVGGPLGVLCLAPLAIALVMDQGRQIAAGAGLSIAAAAVAAVGQLLGVALPPPPPPVALGLGLLGLAVIVMTLGSGLILGRRQVLAQEVRRDEETARLTRLLAGQPHLLVALYPHGKVRALYGRAPEGVDPDVLIQQGLTAVAAQGEPVAEALRAAAAEGRAEVAFAPVTAQDRWIAVTLRRAEDDLLLAVLRDATTDHAREASLDQARIDAETLAAGKSRFLANMSHELRTPLNAIMGFSDIMRSRLFGPMPDKYGEYSGLIHEAGSHLLDLINDVLDMSKIEADRFELSREPFDAREAVSAALRLMRLQADGAGVQLRGILPAGALEIDADRRALKQIVLNLVSNALKFTPKGGAITVTAHGFEGVFELVVADTGVGISPEDLERLGRPYEQAGDNDRRAMGTGLGLSLVRSFAELHGGEMTLESTLGEGTTVTIRLPVLLPPVAAAAATPSPNVVELHPLR
ncbi:HAMP domain-containing sensor histidine kinase [Caulobacter sp. SLTY]|uniref:sensor histidine kinase n=1 Tax=Caulobacter sp. SLTY TaxID=2683262 RepID=UPI0023F1A0DC|nr:HAMP domain-containing sensor histidine kinase [Caulobacter sp. SLTY]